MKLLIRTYRLINEGFISLFILTFFVFSNALAQTNEDKIVKSLNKIIVPINTFQPDSNFQDISFLKEILKDKSIIGLGEATHGTHEFFLYKDRLIRFLITNLNFKAIAFESDFATVLNLNGYINGEIDEMCFSGGFPATEEIKSMLKWLKESNLTQPKSDKVQIYGLEARGFSNISKLLLDSLSNLSETNKTELQKFKDTNFNSLTKKDVDGLKLILPSLFEFVKKQGSSSLHNHYVRLLEQEIIEYSSKHFGIRDDHMFENASWLKENTLNKKMILWAHNGHLSKANIYKQTTIGKQLFQKYGDEYYVIATDFNHGDTGVFVKENKEWKYQDVYYPKILTKNGYEYFFNKCKFNNFFIDVEEASKDENLYQFFKQKHDMHSIGGIDKPSTSNLSILDCFDLIAFFNKTTAVK
jgi:erythromycin esterase